MQKAKQIKKHILGKHFKKTETIVIRMFYFNAKIVYLQYKHITH